MKFRTLMMAASALVLIQAGPAYAACQDDLASIENNLGGSAMSDKIEDKLAEARHAAELNNASLCENILSEIREIAAAPATQIDAGVLTVASADTALNEEEMAMNSSDPTGGGSMGMQGGAPDDSSAQNLGDSTADRITGEAQDGVQDMEDRLTDTTDPDDDTTLQTGESIQTQTPSTLTVGQVQGVSATNRIGEEIGQVDSIVRNRDTGEVFVVISSNGFLGMGGDETAVPLTLVTLDTDSAIVDLASKSELDTYERFDENRFEPISEETNLSELNAPAQVP